MTYQILPYTFNKANKYGVSVKPSIKKTKKIDVFKNGTKIASIGGIRTNGTPYNDYPTYINLIGKVKADKKRSAYLKRHAHEPKWKIKKGVKVRTPSYWSKVLLW